MVFNLVLVHINLTSMRALYANVLDQFKFEIILVFQKPSGMLVITKGNFVNCASKPDWCQIALLAQLYA